MPTIHDIIGAKFGKLTVIEQAGIKGDFILWKCLCECGGERITRYYDLKRGKTSSCGCFKKAILVKRNKSHGFANTRIYHIWLGIVKRCTNPNSSAWKYYGARGIKVCDQWLYFEGFYSDMKDGYADNLSLDRYPNMNGNYEPNNCRWATAKEQANNKSNNRVLDFCNRRMTVQQWADELGMDQRLICARLGRGWSIEKSLTWPKEKSGGNKRKLLMK